MQDFSLSSYFSRYLYFYSVFFRVGFGSVCSSFKVFLLFICSFFFSPFVCLILHTSLLNKNETSFLYIQTQPRCAVFVYIIDCVLMHELSGYSFLYIYTKIYKCICVNSRGSLGNAHINIITMQSLYKSRQLALKLLYYLARPLSCFFVSPFYSFHNCFSMKVDNLIGDLPDRTFHNFHRRFQIRGTTFLNYISLVDLLILGL